MVLVVVSSVVLVGVQVPDVIVVKSVVVVVDVVVVDVVVVGSVLVGVQVPDVIVVKSVVDVVVVVVVVVEMCGKSAQTYESHGHPFGQFSMHGQLLLSRTLGSATHF